MASRSNMQKQISTLLFVFALAGCSTDAIVTTGPWPEITSPPPAIKGAYFLPIAKFPITVVRKSCEIKITLGDAAYHPDVKHHYTLDYQPDDFSADTAVLGTDSDGLLQTINGSGDPQASAIIGKVFEVVGDIGKLTALSVGKAAPSCNPSDAKSDFTITYLADVTDPAEKSALQEKLPEGIAVDAVEAIRLGSALKDTRDHGCIQADADDAEKNTLPKKRSGVCYRAVWPFNVTVTLIEAIKGTSDAAPDLQKFSVTTAVAMPDRSQVLYVPLNRNGLAKTDIKLTFSHGMLTKYDETRPSKALAVIGFPADILKGIFGLGPSSASAASAKK